MQLPDTIHLLFNRFLYIVNWQWKINVNRVDGYLSVMLQIYYTVYKVLLLIMKAGFGKKKKS